MKNSYSILISILILLAPYGLTYNYLVFCPLFAHSHHKFLAKIADTLSEAGHNVTFLAPIIVKKYQDVEYLEHTSDIIYIQPNEELEKIGARLESTDFSKFWEEDSDIRSSVSMLKMFHKMFLEIYENLKNHLKVLDALRDRKFDAMFYEVIAFNAIAIQDYLEIPTLFPTFSITHHVQLSRTIGEPMLPSIVSSPLSPFGEPKTFQERLSNTIFDMALQMLSTRPDIHSYKHPYEHLDVRNAESRASFVFLNSNPLLDFPRPMLFKSVQIGGISMDLSENEQLPKELDVLLAEHPKTILISFGSIMKSKDMPESYRSCILKVIKNHPDVHFIWKYESDDLKFAEGLPNLHFSKWIPQTALLGQVFTADRRVSAFITHAGLGSVNELSYSGKPAILIPVFGDQMRNAKMLARHNGSIYLEKRDLGDFEKLNEAVNSILYDESYSQCSQQLSHRLAHQPMSPRQLLVRFAEFGAEFGELPFLAPYSRKMSVFSLYLIDVFVFLGVVIFVSLWALLRALKSIRMSFRMKEKKY